MDTKNQVILAQFKVSNNRSFFKFVTTLLVTVGIFYFSLKVEGYEFAKYLSIISTPIIYLFLFRYKNLFAFFLFSIVYLTIFDNDLLNWTSLKIRPWYFIVLLILLISFFKRFIKADRFRIKKNIFTFALFYFIVMSIIYFLAEDMLAKLYILKYWLFSIGLIFSLLFVSNNSKLALEKIVKMWFFVVLFSMLWGLLQFVGNILGFAGDSLQHDWYNFSPSAFFSERTWYGQYSAIGSLLSLYYFAKTRKYIFLFLFLISISCIAISSSRSAIIPLLSGTLALVTNILLKMRINRKLLYHSAIILLLIIPLSSINFTDNLSLLSLFSKFDPSDVGIQGRFEALNLYFSNVKKNPVGYILGNGFSWDPSQASSIGTAVGAKSSNLFLMIWHVFGVFGLFFSVLIFFYYSFRYLLLLRMYNSSEVILGFSLWLTFFGLSFTVPAHQYPPTLVILFFSISIFKRFVYAK